MSRTIRERQGIARPGARSARRAPRNRRKPNYVLLSVLFLAAALLSGVASFALQTPSLVVKEVKISGVKLADRAEVERLAKRALGRNIITLRPLPILSRIRGLHEVRDVKMGRSLPNKLWIRVIERLPDAVLVVGPRYWMVQLDGLVFHAVGGPVPGLPAVEVAEGGDVKEGSKCTSPDVQCALAVLKYARLSRLDVSKISVDQLGDMCLNMEGGFYVKLGQPEEIARKVSILHEALVYRPSIGREAAYIDLSCPSAPVWKPKIAVSAAS